MSEKKLRARWGIGIIVLGTITLIWGIFAVLLASWFGRINPPTREMLYMSNLQGDWDIYSLDVERGLTTLLTVDASPPDSSFFEDDDRYPAYSPDGQSIAFHSNINGNWDIFLMNADGSDVHQLTTALVDEAMPAWSPDGRYIAYHRCDNMTPCTGSTSTFDNWNIYILDVTTGEQRRITSRFGEETFPAWSPDGTMLAFVSDRDGDSEIYICVNLERCDYSSRRLTHNDFDDWSPAWSPDGQYIAYVTDEPANYGVMVMDVDGDNKRPLVTMLPSNEWNPVWIIDEGRMQLLVVSNIDGTEQIYRVEFDGVLGGFDDSSRLTSGWASNWSPEWRPLPCVPTCEQGT